MSQREAAARLVWAKSSRCDSAQCLEVAWPTGVVAVRDNTVPDAYLTFDRASWSGLLAAARAGQFDR
jgi:hypothetical protein